jgi:hypothetical protein
LSVYDGSGTIFRQTDTGASPAEIGKDSVKWNIVWLGVGFPMKFACLSSSLSPPRWKRAVCLEGPAISALLTMKRRKANIVWGFQIVVSLSHIESLTPEVRSESSTSSLGRVGMSWKDFGHFLLRLIFLCKPGGNSQVKLLNIYGQSNAEDSSHRLLR